VALKVEKKDVFLRKKVLIPIFFLQQIGWEEEDRFRKREKQLS